MVTTTITDFCKTASIKNVMKNFDHSQQDGKPLEPGIDTFQIYFSDFLNRGGN